MIEDVTDQRRLLRRLAALVWASLLFAMGAAQASTTIEGEFALIGGTPQVAGELVATPQATPTDLKLDISLHRVAEKNALKRYETELTQQMHVIAVSDDLGVFMHHHVAHVIDGHGQVRMVFPAPGLYHVFVDAAPKTIGQQVLRFDLLVGDEPVTPLISRPLGAPDTSARSGLYTLSFDRLELRAGAESELSLHVAAHGKPAKDLHPYLGVAAPAVLIGAEALGYAHVHPMVDLDMAPHQDGAPDPDADAATVPADLTLLVPALPAGAYKLWVQFIGGRTLYAVPFVVVVK